MTTHLIFDFFGTLVEYSSNFREQEYERTFCLLRESEIELEYDQFLSQWSEAFEKLDRPARESLREFSMGELQASPEQCIYVGDSYEADYLGAKSAGIRALLIDPLHETPVVNEDRIESVFEMEKRVAEVESG